MQKINSFETTRVPGRINSLETSTDLKCVAKYKLGNQLGKGAYGCVYEATDEFLQDFALKRVRTVKEDDKIYFENEVTILKLLCKGTKHPNIIELVVSYKESDFSSAMVFELAECDLDVFLTRQKCDLSRETMQSFAYQLLSAVSYCHSKGVVHGDIKPMNILTFGNGSQLKLSDFGAANAFSITKRIYTGCTYVYAPPEQFLSNLLVAKEALDMWSYGMTLLEICRRKRLFSTSSVEREVLLFIFEQFGTPTIESWPEGVIQLEKYDKKFPKFSAKPLQGFDESLGPCGLRLVNKILVLDPSKRWSARSCMLHEFFWIDISCDERELFSPRKRQRIV